ICFIFIGIRAGLTAAIAMIMTLLMTLGILYLFGITLNTITLFGLVLCLGLIVDDIVIVTESIDTQRKKLSNLREAVTVAIKKIAKASSAGTLTTALGFAPLLFFGGILGKFIKVLPITIIISLFVSLFVSLTFVPLLTRLIHASKDNPNKYSPLTYFRNGVEWLAKLLSSVILSAKSTKRKFVYTFVAILISIGFLMASGPLYSKLKFDIFPTPKDANELQVEFVFGPGTNIDSAIEKTNEANQIITNVLGDDIQKISYQGNANERQATATVTLTPFDEREQTSRQFVNELNKQLTNIDNTRISVSQISAGPPKERLPFVVQINADDPQKANEAAKNLVSFLNDTTINRNNGTEAKVIETEYTGELITLTRIDGKRVVQVRAGFDADDTTAIVQAAQKEVEDNFLSDSSNLAGLSADDFGFDFGVESQNQDSFRSVLLALPVLLLLMYLLLVIQFKSLVQPILILLAVPFSFFGVGLALNTTDNPISFFTMIGFFALIGISVNNTILLTDFANQGRRLGLSPRQAMASALHERLRPLLTTTITSVSALIPLTLSDPFWESLSITLIGGLLSSALLVVIAFPYYYLVLEFLRSRLQLKYKK
ncbi:efflux RND transporter permease subunit, partial [Candidatus Saccharibacteria bacterium]|nr:efflux RND transporter permease subunit [Candidatus Saccharibacteria bacterium]